MHHEVDENASFARLPVTSLLVAVSCARHERRYTPNRNPTVRTLRQFCPDFQELPAISLGDEVLRRHFEGIGEDNRYGFCTPIRQRQIVNVGANRVGMALN
jgi:hypothetical protein